MSVPFHPWYFWNASMPDDEYMENATEQLQSIQSLHKDIKVRPTFADSDTTYNADNSFKNIGSKQMQSDTAALVVSVNGNDIPAESALKYHNMRKQANKSLNAYAEKFEEKFEEKYDESSSLDDSNEEEKFISEDCIATIDTSKNKLVSVTGRETRRSHLDQLSMNMGHTLVGQIAHCLYRLHNEQRRPHLNINTSQFSNFDVTIVSELWSRSIAELIKQNNDETINFDLLSQEMKQYCNDDINFQSPQMADKHMKCFNGYKADAWAFGIFIFYLFFGFYPYNKNGACFDAGRSQYILCGRLKELLEYQHPQAMTLIPKGGLDLLNGLFRLENERLTMKDVINHPFIKNAPKSSCSHDKCNDEIKVWMDN